MYWFSRHLFRWKATIGLLGLDDRIGQKWRRFDRHGYQRRSRYDNVIRSDNMTFNQLIAFHLHCLGLKVMTPQQLDRALYSVCWASIKMFKLASTRNYSKSLAIRIVKQPSMTPWKWNILNAWLWNRCASTHQCRWLRAKSTKMFNWHQRTTLFQLERPLSWEHIKSIDDQVNKNEWLAPCCWSVNWTFLLIQSPDIYANPDVFNPDNFLPERTQNRHYYSFIPFSAGPRSCVGRKYAMLKLKVLLSTILRNYRIKSSLTQDDFKLQADIILKRTDGFRVEIEPRQRVVA